MSYGPVHVVPGKAFMTASCQSANKACTSAELLILCWCLCSIATEAIPGQHYNFTSLRRCKLQEKPSLRFRLRSCNTFIQWPIPKSVTIESRTTLTRESFCNRKKKTRLRNGSRHAVIYDLLFTSMVCSPHTTNDSLKLEAHA